MKQTRAPFDVRYRVFTPADLDDTAALLANAFSNREPIGIAVGMTEAEFGGFVGMLLASVEMQQLTIVARRSDTGEMLGALITEDAASDSGAGLESLGEKFAMVGSILGALVSTYGRHSDWGETLHLFLLGVRDGAEGMGIGSQLVAACIEHGARLGYRSAIAECTGRTSQHIFRKLGFAERGMVSYADHEFNGCRVFASIAEHGGPILMEKILAAN